MSANMDHHTKLLHACVVGYCYVYITLSLHARFVFADEQRTVGRLWGGGLLVVFVKSFLLNFFGKPVACVLISRLKIGSRKCVFRRCANVLRMVLSFGTAEWLNAHVYLSAFNDKCMEFIWKTCAPTGSHRVLSFAQTLYVYVCSWSV